MEITDCLGNLPPLSQEFRFYLNSQIPLTCRNKNVMLHQRGSRLSSIYVISQGLVVGFRPSGKHDNVISYLWKASEPVILPGSFFEPYTQSEYFLQTLRPSKIWLIDETPWEYISSNFNRDADRLRHALHINFMQKQEELSQLRHMEYRERYHWYESIYGTNLLKNDDVASFLGIKSRTLDRIKNGK